MRFCKIGAHFVYIARITSGCGEGVAAAKTISDRTQCLIVDDMERISSSAIGQSEKEFETIIAQILRYSNDKELATTCVQDRQVYDH